VVVKAVEKENKEAQRNQLKEIIERDNNMGVLKASTIALVVGLIGIIGLQWLLKR